MGEVQTMLFGRPAANTLPRTDMTPSPIPGSPTGRAGAEHIRPQAPGLRAMVLAVLDEAGAVSTDGRYGGATIQELAGMVSELRGRPVKETTICGRLGELRKAGLVVGSDKTRMGNAGVAIKVFVHQQHAQPVERVCT